MTAEWIHPSGPVEEMSALKNTQCSAALSWLTCAGAAGCFHAVLAGGDIFLRSSWLCFPVPSCVLTSSLTLSGEPVQGAPAVHQLPAEAPGALARGLQLCRYLRPQLQWSSPRV